ncbi:uncharacterized protein LOC114724113 [Neltuma alba]|uniref:uncharacterized protein LOC114724113 n=1 Tax=Neltuma alba TaxID=207710 RepID=UPI0010A2C8EE|nr:uncharacterized protein LOC114724113 [Prosopis alba]
MKTTDNSDPITLSDQLSSLLGEIPAILHLKGKWSLIASKLHLLRSRLADFSSHFPHSSSSNSLSRDLLLSIAQTLNDAVSLVKDCQLPTLSHGKLKTQSLIDSLLASLDRHLSDCDVLLKSGVLRDDAISTASNRDAVRSELRNLTARLQIGSSDSRIFAMDSFLGLLQEDDKNVMIAVAQGVVPLLVRLLDSSSSEMKEKIVAAISRVSMVDSIKHALIAEGLVLLNHLLRILDHGSGFAKEKACTALQALTFSRENARAIGSRGGISSLLDICQVGTPGSQASAAGVLRNLVVYPEVRVHFVEENAVVVLLGLASSGTAIAQENAIGCLSNLISDDESLKLTSVKERGIECLKNFWDSVSSVQSLEVAIELLRSLASSPSIAEVLISDGFVQKLVGVLHCGVLRVRIAAARAVYTLGSSTTKAKKEMGECGCITPLIQMLDGKAVEEKEAAAMALSILMFYTGNRRIFRKDERGIVSAVQLLDPSIENLDKKYPVSILVSLVHSKTCRKQIAAAGASVHTRKLVEMNVEGSKKLLDSLGRAKVWEALARSFG